MTELPVRFELEAQPFDKGQYYDVDLSVEDDFGYVAFRRSIRHARYAERGAGEGYPYTAEEVATKIRNNVWRISMVYQDQSLPEVTDLL